MKIYLFAVLKEYFPNMIHIEPSDHIRNVEDLVKHLASQNNESATVLKSCRFAVNNKFIDKKFTLNSDTDIAVIPPSSGG